MAAKRGSTLLEFQASLDGLALDGWSSSQDDRDAGQRQVLRQGLIKRYHGTAPAACFPSSVSKVGHTTHQDQVCTSRLGDPVLAPAPGRFRLQCFPDLRHERVVQPHVLGDRLLRRGRVACGRGCGAAGWLLGRAWHSLRVVTSASAGRTCPEAVDGAGDRGRQCCGETLQTRLPPVVAAGDEAAEARRVEVDSLRQVLRNVLLHGAHVQEKQS
mmetsp:Transcript_105520/g.315174  ORF Transcript_105520/g.315174 Transcript_105520/m.315174 type:complete len:214 (+) Transcript_105520:1089-1730(+)